MVTDCLPLQDYIGKFVEFAELVERQAVESMKQDLAYADVPAEFKGEMCLCKEMCSELAFYMTRRPHPHACRRGVCL